MVINLFVVISTSSKHPYMFQNKTITLSNSCFNRYMRVKYLQLFAKIKLKQRWQQKCKWAAKDDHFMSPDKMLSKLTSWAWRFFWHILNSMNLNGSKDHYVSAESIEYNLECHRLKQLWTPCSCSQHSFTNLWCLRWAAIKCGAVHGSQLCSHLVYKMSRYQVCGGARFTALLTSSI